MDVIQLKIEKDNSMIKYIKIIRKFDSSLSVGVIKQRMEENDFVVSFDLDYYDVVEDINGIDRKEIFNNWLETLNKISQQVEYDIDRELEN